MPDLETKESASVVRDAMTFATGLMWHSVHCICRPTRLHVSDFRWPSASSRRVCAARALYHMQMREWYYTKGEFSKCHSARKLWEILCFERVLHSSPRPPRADWRDAIANPIKTHDSVFTTCRSFLAIAWGLIVFAALFSFSSPSETSVGFRSRNLRSKLLFHSLILELVN